jgi:hypothetical protein
MSQINDINFTAEDSIFDVEDLSPERHLSEQVESLLPEEKEIAALFDDKLEKEFGYDNSDTPEFDLDEKVVSYKMPKQAEFQNGEGAAKLGPEYLEGFLNFLVEETDSVQDIKSALHEKFSKDTLNLRKEFITKHVHTLLTEKKRMSFQTNRRSPENSHAQGYEVGYRVEKTSGLTTDLVQAAKTFMSTLREKGWIADMERIFASSFPTDSVEQFKKDLLSALSKKITEYISGGAVFSTKASISQDKPYMPSKEVVVSFAHSIDGQGFGDDLIDDLVYLSASTAASLFRAKESELVTSTRIEAEGFDEFTNGAHDMLSAAIGVDSQELADALTTAHQKKMYASKSQEVVDESVEFKRQALTASRGFLAGIKDSGWLDEIRGKFSSRYPNSDIVDFDKKFAKAVSASLNKYLSGDALSATVNATSKDFFPSRQSLLVAADSIGDKRLCEAHLSSFAQIVSSVVHGIFTERAIEASKGTRLSREELGGYTETARQYFEEAVPDLEVETSYDDSGFSMSDIDLGSEDLLEKESKSALELDGSFFYNEEEVE